MSRGFPELQTVNLDRALAWISGLPEQVSTIVEFGCTSSEPFGLVALLGARRAVVVEPEISHLTQSSGLSPVDEFGLLSRKYPQQFPPFSIGFVVGDVRKSPLAPSIFDLAYCENVLYYFSDDEVSLAYAISEMIRVVRLGGFLAAREPKLGADYRFVDTMLGNIPTPQSAPRDISGLFETAGLVRFDIPGAPPYSYCYRKTWELAHRWSILCGTSRAI